MDTQPPENYLHTALERIQNWEQHHVSRVPRPLVRKTTATSFERRAADWITAFAGSMRFVYPDATSRSIWRRGYVLPSVLSARSGQYPLYFVGLPPAAPPWLCRITSCDNPAG